ncbi:hypothetical protein EDM53_01875 [Rickettsiales endosymbiont of Peranema trichophorum]|uniref:hypothetical protein n=1 Tax=Rickettsiales endosymbiont of Peranema trichophorum TaxID=2486577 RepID=UPI001023AF35|nr:hypothetical protein [Rickettsiales endosymbiont of Peranema trichophorum]RZI47442.1 hypothetical protein EDM53_01875 [Rickettsiales endosymbiont of Peranema trichophorum]
MRIKLYARLLLMITLIALPLGEVMSEEGGVVKKKYPPYPDVWGYDFPNAYGGVRTYLAPDGEVIMSFEGCSCEGCCEGKEEQWTGQLVYYVRKFFEGTDIRIGDEVARDQFVKANGLKDEREIVDDQITLRNGVTIYSYCDRGGKLCYPDELEHCTLTKGRKKAGDNYLNRYQKDAEVFSIVRLYNNISMDMSEDIGGKYDCGGNGGPLFYHQLSFFSSRFIALDDDTFLACSIWGNEVVRFDQNMETKFQLSGKVELAPGEAIEGKLFVVPYSVIQRLSTEVYQDDDYRIQGLHDRLLLYLYEQHGKKEGNIKQ